MAFGEVRHSRRQFSSWLRWRQAFACHAYTRCMLSTARIGESFVKSAWVLSVNGRWTALVYVYSAACLSWPCDGVNWANTASISSLPAGRWLDWLWAGLCTATLQTEPRAAHTHTHTHTHTHACMHAHLHTHTHTLAYNYMYAVTNTVHLILHVNYVPE